MESGTMSSLMKPFLAFCLFLISFSGNAEVYVSPVMATDAIHNNYVVGPGALQVIQLPSKGTNQDNYLVKINASNAIYKDITAFIVDQHNLLLYQNGRPFRGIGYQKAIAPFVIQGSTNTPGPKFLILDNRYATIIAKKLNISIEAKFPLDFAEQEKTKKIFADLYAELKKNLNFPDFDIYVKPCGEVNAYSESFGTGNVHYCTELISQLSRTNNIGAFTAIFFHEIGHSLLGLWGIPGNNNEDIADEFSTYMLMSSGPSGYALLDRSLEFWMNKDSYAEAMHMLHNGDRHSLSIQRIRNIKENIQRGEEFIGRWNKLIYQHATNDALNRVTKNPRYGDDIELAQKILAQRNYIE